MYIMHYFIPVCRWECDRLGMQKSDLEEKQTVMQELKQKVDESKTECAYQLRLKDNQNLEQIKEINPAAVLISPGPGTQSRICR